MNLEKKCNRCGERWDESTLGYSECLLGKEKLMGEFLIGEYCIGCEEFEGVPS